MVSTYNVTSKKQLIDLNGDMKNFELTFTATASPSSSVFEAIVVDQKMLDNNEDIEYKTINTGSIGGTLVSDKDVYQNYYLILKVPDNEPSCNVTVEINKREIPPNIPIELEPEPKSKLSYFSNINWKTILIIIAVGLAIFLFFKFFINKKDISLKSMFSRPSLSIAPPIAPPITLSMDQPIVPPMDIPTSSPIAPLMDQSIGSPNDILSRINNLDF